MPSDIQELLTHEDVTKFMNEAEECGLVAVRIKSESPDPYARQPLVAFFYTPKQGYFLQLDKYPLLLQTCKPVFNRSNLIKVFHDGKRDLKFLYRFWGPDGEDYVYCQGIFDTYIASKLLPDEQKLSLKDLCQKYLGRSLPDSPDPSDAQLEASLLLDLRIPLRKALLEQSMVKAAKMEFDLIPVIAYMELTGIYMDRERWEMVWQKWRTRQKVLAEKLSQSLGSHLPGALFGSEIFNPDSHQQVKEALHAMGLNVTNVGENSLKPYVDSYEEVADLLAYRQVASAVQNCGNIFIDHIHPLTKRIHSHYEQIGAATGRMSCSNPNIQQVPRQYEIRTCFTAPSDKKLIVADYSQIELRVAASIAKDRRMLEAYHQTQDLHSLTASLILGLPIRQVSSKDRQKAKAVNFGLLYAMGAKGLAEYAANQYGVKLSLEEAHQFCQRFFKAYSGIAKWHEQTKKLIQSAGNRTGTIRSAAGRVFRYDGSTSLSWLLNAPVQGGAAEVMKRAMVRLFSVLDQSIARIVGVVHDELIVECDASQAENILIEVKKQMEAAGREFYPDVPFVSEASIANSWGEAK
jgi:DNA polymerase-1